MLAVQGVPRALLILVGGALADRLSHRTVMVFSMVARAVVAGVLAGLVAAGLAHLWWLFAAALLLGAISAFFMPARGAILPSLVDPAQLEPANSLLTVNQQAAAVIGPALAGVVVAAWGSAPAFFADAAAYAAGPPWSPSFQAVPVRARGRGPG
ncbi:MAG: MFS transporter [Candidatus Dormibacteraeota bacterium]|nr:MFS transporter [Candidatus Dormibacteraeota bacterium]